MRVRAEVRREVAFEMAAVHVQVLQRSSDHVWSERGRATKQFQRPEPRNRAVGNLEAARPVDAVLRRIGIHPRRQVRSEALGVCRLAGNLKCATKDEKML